VSQHQSAIDVTDSNGTVVFVCRNPDRRAIVERLIQPIQTHAAAMDALLAVARKAPRAVLINLEDVAGSGQAVLAALRRCRPDVPVGILVAPEDEPLGRQLVAEGAATYFVLPGDVQHLPAFLHPKTPSPTSAAAVGDSRAVHLFRAACELAELATSQPQPLFRDGAMLILGALGVRQGCVFSCDAETGGPELVATFGRTEPDTLTALEAERAAAERALRTGEVLLVEAGTVGAPPGGLLGVPVRHGDATFGILCLSDKTDGTSLDGSDRDAATALADVLAHLYRSALMRSEYARLALRDVRTGLLKADPFLTYLEARIARAEDLHAEVGLLLIRPEPGVQAQKAGALDRLGVGIRAALQAHDETENDVYGAAATRLAEVGREVDAELRLRTALAVYPRDGATARALVAAAEARLAAPA